MHVSLPSHCQNISLNYPSGFKFSQLEMSEPEICYDRPFY